MRALKALLLAICLVPAPRDLHGQERGAAALSEEVRGLGVTLRVLMIGAHPDDEDTQLITWLARGQRVETAYLSLTRGDGGQNIIGNELGPALGVIRTEELLAARRVDGGRQYFTRAYDFGFSKSAEETFQHWPRDVLLRDIVSVVRAFRPHVIVAVFSGTPRDGHGHHQAAGMLAREAWDAAGDTVRFPAGSTGGIGAWQPAKFYRAQRFRPEEATLRMNVGEYDPVLGRSYAEIAGQSRSQHRSQAFGALQPLGVRWDYVRLEGSRVTDVGEAAREASMFDGIAGGWSRFASLQLPPPAATAFGRLEPALASVDEALDLRNPHRVVEPLAGYVRLLQDLRAAATAPVQDTARVGSGACPVSVVPLCRDLLGDMVVSLGVELKRAERALLTAAGVQVEANAARPLVAVGDGVPVAVEVYNRGKIAIAVGLRVLEPDSVSRDTILYAPTARTEPWWLIRPLAGGVFQLEPAPSSTGRWTPAPALVLGEDVLRDYGGSVPLRIAGTTVHAPISTIAYRYADPVEGEIRRPVHAVPAISVLLENEVEYLPAGRPVTRSVRVSLRSASTDPRTADVRLVLPPGLEADSASRTVTLTHGGEEVVSFTVSGSVPAGTVSIAAVVESGGKRFAWGYVPIDYRHISPQHVYRRATTRYTALDVRVPAELNVAYVPGVGDNIPAMLRQLGVPVTVIEREQLATADLGGYSTLVIGPRAYDASASLLAGNARVLDFARQGGTVVVQYGQYEMQQPGLMPYPITLARPHDRVTDERAPVRILAPHAALLRTPNAITAEDFEGWVQERSLYMPRTFDGAYMPLLEMHDPGEPPNRGALLVAPFGRGTYVYTTLSFFRQLPAGVPGAARLFVNLLAAGSPPPTQ